MCVSRASHVGRRNNLAICRVVPIFTRGNGRNSRKGLSRWVADFTLSMDCHTYTALRKRNASADGENLGGFTLPRVSTRLLRRSTVSPEKSRAAVPKALGACYSGGDTDAPDMHRLLCE
jgi:hypothetical protein